MVGSDLPAQMRSDAYVAAGTPSSCSADRQVSSRDRFARQYSHEQTRCRNGEDDQKVHEWLTTAAGVPGFIGFAVGRTSFWDPLVKWRAKKITREEAVNEITGRYREFVQIFEAKA